MMMMISTRIRSASSFVEKKKTNRQNPTKRYHGKSLSPSSPSSSLLLLKYNENGMKCCCVSNFIRRGKTSRRSSKGQKRSQKKDNKQDKSKNLNEIFRDFTRDNKLLRRDKFLRENKQFFTPFSKCSASIAVLKIHDKPLPYY